MELQMCTFLEHLAGKAGYKSTCYLARFSHSARLV